jgi:hypothetical protein
MSYADGWAAMNLEMPSRVPRTEYSASMHWDLVKVVTGIDVDAWSSDEIKAQADVAFVKAWNYDLQWSVMIAAQVFGDIRTNMGHAVYAAGGVDYNDAICCPFASPDDVLAFDPMDALGRINKAQVTKDFENHYKMGCKVYPDLVNMTGIYITLISGFIDLFGWDMLLMAAGTDPVAFGLLANRYTEWIGQYFEALADADVPVVMIHDDMVWTSGAVFNPSWYREYVFPNYRKLFRPLIDSGKKVLFTSDGTYTQFIDDIADCGIHGFVMEPTTDMKYIAEKYGKTHVFIGNADTRILLSGTKADIRAEVQRCMEIGKRCPGFFMAVGNHIPPNTPVENALYYNEVYNELGRR